MAKKFCWINIYAESWACKPFFPFLYAKEILIIGAGDLMMSVDALSTVLHTICLLKKKHFICVTHSLIYFHYSLP
jgi:hypothetical protein